MTVLISLSHVSFDFNRHRILSDISLELKSNQITTLLGPNGAGKSTLTRIILGLLVPTKGEIKKISNLAIGYVPQKIILNSTLPITVERFMSLARHVSIDKITTTLALVGAGTFLHKSMQQLSGGEMQRVLLAQAMLRDPQLLVLDEPAQGVDVKGQIALYQLIEQTKKKAKMQCCHCLA